jgi:alpha-D-ribose 1-methylphosphonate 5-triphosphate diphosphatase
MARYRVLRQKQQQMSDAAVDQRIEELLERRARLREPQRRWLLDRLAHRDLPLASHDDDEIAEVARNARDGIRISEFPVTLAAAQAAREIGVEVIAGAPNIVRGGSHSGNVAVTDLIAAGAVDALASDYVPAALIEAAFTAAATAGLGLPAAIAMITDRPARMARLADRGRLAPGLRADLVRVTPHAGLPVVREVWRAGSRVA